MRYHRTEGALQEAGGERPGPSLGCSEREGVNVTGEGGGGVGEEVVNPLTGHCPSHSPRTNLGRFP